MFLQRWKIYYGWWSNQTSRWRDNGLHNWTSFEKTANGCRTISLPSWTDEISQQRYISRTGISIFYPYSTTNIRLHVYRYLKEKRKYSILACIQIINYYFHRYHSAIPRAPESSGISSRLTVLTLKMIQTGIYWQKYYYD